MPRPIAVVFVTPHFTRAFRKLPGHIQAKAITSELRFRKDAFDPRLRTHALQGPLKGMWSFRVDRPNRIMFEFLSADQATFHDIGSHDIYR